MTHTYPAGPAGRTGEARCRACGQRFVVVTVLRPKGTERQPYGTGAEALSKQMKNGHAKVEIRIEPTRVSSR